jgi:hypothetical protein
MKTIIPDSPPVVVSAVPKSLSRRKRFSFWLRKVVVWLNQFRDKAREVQETYIQR